MGRSMEDGGWMDEGSWTDCRQHNVREHRGRNQKKIMADEDG